VHVSTYIVLSLCPFSGLLLFSLLLMLFNKPEIKLTTTTTIFGLLKWRSNLYYARTCLDRCILFLFACAGNFQDLETSEYCFIFSE